MLDLCLEQFLILLLLFLSLGGTLVELFNLRKLFLSALHIAALPLYHFLQILQQVVQAG